MPNYEDYCQRCKNYRFDLNEGVKCGLTNSKPDFDIECKFFHLDESRNVKRKKNFLHSEETFRQESQPALTSELSSSESSHDTPQPSSVKTIGREAGDHVSGCLTKIFGGLVSFAGLAVIAFSVGNGSGTGIVFGIIIILVGAIIAFVGEEEKRKAKHIAWTREAIERDRIYFQKKMPKTEPINSLPNRLKALEKVWQEKLISEEEYLAKRKQLMEIF